MFVIGSDFRHKSFLLLLLVRTVLYPMVAALWLPVAAGSKYLGCTCRGPKFRPD
ncbi:hypothetical protein Hsw_PA0147 (plasmid) [Hymenobacter swuensis DY53]|uniref:Uncharacterized protein n=1 Tax=Hymenobacter swuensis DY53 TaxID=1227739 RepID=W8F0Y3_9BACT|nr:hypothetical protein Hsw_PA0147 [Hymenobacter swuensis DY53]